MTIEEMVAERQQIRMWLEAEDKRFSDFCKPYREKMAIIDQQIMSGMQAQGVTSLKTEHGTAIITQRDTPKILDRDKYLDWCLDNWDAYGNAMLQIGAPKAEAVREYMDHNRGTLPPNVNISTMLTFSVRKA